MKSLELARNPKGGQADLGSSMAKRPTDPIPTVSGRPVDIKIAPLSDAASDLERPRRFSEGSSLRPAAASLKPPSDTEPSETAPRRQDGRRRAVAIAGIAALCVSALLVYGRVPPHHRATVFVSG